MDALERPWWWWCTCFLHVCRRRHKIHRRTSFYVVLEPAGGLTNPRTDPGKEGRQGRKILPVM